MCYLAVRQPELPALVRQPDFPTFVLSASETTRTTTAGLAVPATRFDTGQFYSTNQGTCPVGFIPCWDYTCGPSRSVRDAPRTGCRDAGYN